MGGCFITQSKKRLSKKQLYTRVYKELVRGQTLTKLAASIGYDKGYISRIKDELIQAGFLVPINPRSRAKMYSATKKQFTGEFVNKKIKLTGGAKQQLSHRLSVVKIQKATFITEVKTPPRSNVKWDSSYQFNPYTQVYDYVYPFANVGEIRFRRIVSDKKDRLMIITPPMLWERDAGDPEDYLEQVGRYAAGWIQKRFSMELDGFKSCQKPDYCMTLTDPKLISAAQNGSFSINGMMVNSSAPDEIPEVESKDWEMIEDLSNAPAQIRQLKGEVSEIKGMMNELVQQQREMMGLLQGLVSAPVRPDDFREVV